MEIEWNFKTLVSETSTDENTFSSDALQHWVFLEVEYDEYSFSISAYELHKLVKYTGKILREDYGKTITHEINFTYDERTNRYKSFPPHQIYRRVADFILSNREQYTWLDHLIPVVIGD